MSAFVALLLNEMLKTQGVRVSSWGDLWQGFY